MDQRISVYYIYRDRIRKAHLHRKMLTLLILSLAVSSLSGCSRDTESTDPFADHKTGSMETEYATQFHVDHYEDGVDLISVEDGLKYLLVTDKDALPEWLSGSDLSDYTIIQRSPQAVYNAASSAMDLIDAAGAIDSVLMTSTDARNWGLPEIRKKVENRDILYIGKYRAPDYEALAELDTDLAIESTMIYHTPQIKESIEDLGIPVLVERSSYESDPLGRLEWIRLYGLIFDTAEKADKFFYDSVEKISSVSVDDIGQAPKVAYFYMNPSGAVIIRKPGDYVTKMIETAGGYYAFEADDSAKESATATMNIQMEAFYENASDADILIYSSTLGGSLADISDLTDMSDQFKDFKAVREGNVWCTNSNVFQKTTATADMITEMNRIFSGHGETEDLSFFRKLQ